MRDIRSDLKERADYIENQISATSSDFEETLQHLQRKLKAEIAALGVAMLAEGHRMFLKDLLRHLGGGPETHNSAPKPMSD
jgi:hypothetical protein